jgi:excinuclease ABC subunit A
MSDPDAGEQGGEILYSGPLEGLKAVEGSRTADAIFGDLAKPAPRLRREPRGWLKLRGVTRNNLATWPSSFHSASSRA